MALNKLIVSGEWKTATNWENEAKEHKVPTAAEDTEIPAAKEVKISGEVAKCRSYLCKGTWGAGTGAGFEIGNAEKPNGPAGAAVALKIEAGAIIAHTGGLKLVSTFTAEELKLSVDKSLALKSIVTQNQAKTKYRLEEPLVTNKEIAWSGIESELNTNGKKVEATKLEFNSTKQKVVFGASEVVLTSALGLEVWTAPAEGEVSASSSTFILTGAKAKFAGRGFTYGTVKLKAAEQELKGNDPVMDLVLETAGLEPSILEKGASFTITTLEVPGTTAGAHAKLKTSEAGKKTKIKLPGSLELEAFFDVRDLEVEGGTLYLPNGTDLANGTKTNESNINVVFASKPSATGRHSTIFLLEEDE